MDAKRQQQPLAREVSSPTMSGMGYGQLVREQPAFRKLWLGQVASFLGDWFNLIAIYTAVQSITSSPLAIAAVVAAKTMPNFVMIPVAGPLIDRFDRRKLLLVTDFARAVCVVGLIAAHLAASLVGLYAFTLLMVAFTGIAIPAKKSALPMLVERKQIGVANALMGGTWSVMLALGAAMGGVAVQTLGINAAFAIDGVTFLVSAYFSWGLPKLIPPGKPDASSSFIEGVRYLRRTSYIQAVACVKPLMAFGNSVVLVVIPIYGTIVFAEDGHAGPAYVGMLYAARGTGAAVGSLVLRVVFGDEPPVVRRLIGAGHITTFAALLLLGAASSFWMAALALFLAALGSGGNWVLSGSLLQLQADPAFHGRVFAMEFGVTTMVLAVGGLAAGVMQEWGIAPHDVVSWWAMLGVPAGLFWFGTMAAVATGHVVQPVPTIEQNRC